jgi:hypothetical protein
MCIHKQLKLELKRILAVAFLLLSSISFFFFGNKGFAAGMSNSPVSQKTIFYLNHSVENTLTIPNDLTYNEIPVGVRLIKSEEEWLRISPNEPCCCYPMFSDFYKGNGLLYNYNAYKLIRNKLKMSNQGSTVCSDSDWAKQLNSIKSSKSNIEKNKLNYYPGFYDQEWFGPELNMVGYWYNDHSMLNFSADTYGEPMIDDNLYDDDEMQRRSIVALSIRIVKSSAIVCGQNNWANEACFYRGQNNSIQFVSNKSDWEKLTLKGKACCCYYQFSSANQEMGFLYNKMAFSELSNDPSISQNGYRLVTEIDWTKLVFCAKENNIQANIFDCEKQDHEQFVVHSIGFYDGAVWFANSSNVCRYWLKSGDQENVVSIYCNSGELKKINSNPLEGYFVQLIKK